MAVPSRLGLLKLSHWVLLNRLASFFDAEKYATH